MLTLLLSPSSAVSGTAVEQSTNAPIDHTIVIFLENHTFDNLYGRFPDANGLDQPGAQVPQVDKDGVIYQSLPQPIDASKKPPEPDSCFPARLPNAPFWINEYVSLDEIVPSPVHRLSVHKQHEVGPSYRAQCLAAWRSLPKHTVNRKACEHLCIL